jgi:hypothetical protein
MINIKALLSIVFRKLNLPKENAVIIKNTAMTIDRIVVAKVESMFFKPNFPNIATSAANTAESRAYMVQFMSLLYHKYKNTYSGVFVFCGGGEIRSLQLQYTFSLFFAPQRSKT